MYLLAVYLKLACPTPRKLRAPIILMGLVFMFWRFAVAAFTGLISLSLLVESLLLLPVVYLGVTVGTRFFGALSDARFYRRFQVILLLMAMEGLGGGALTGDGAGGKSPCRKRPRYKKPRCKNPFSA